MAHQAGAYPGFCSMKRLGIFLLPPGWDVSPSQGKICTVLKLNLCGIEMDPEKYSIQRVDRWPDQLRQDAVFCEPDIRPIQGQV